MKSILAACLGILASGIGRGPAWAQVQSVQPLTGIGAQALPAVHIQAVEVQRSLLLPSVPRAQPMRLAAPRAQAPARGLARVKAWIRASQVETERLGREVRDGDGSSACREAGKGFDGTEKSFAELLEENLAEIASGKALSGRHFDDPLHAERPWFSPGLASHIEHVEKAVVEAVREAADKSIFDKGISVISRGSTARKTYIERNPDIDVQLALPKSWSSGAVDAFFENGLKKFMAALEQSAAKKAAGVFQGKALSVRVDGPINLSGPFRYKPEPGVLMVALKVLGPSKEPLIDADVTLTNRPDYANDYPGYFSDQIRRVRELGGDSAVEGVLDDIRLAKRLFKESVGSYKPYHGGPGGVGAEQMVMQSGRVSEADKGRTILEVGSFDKMMEQVYRAAFDDGGRRRPLKKVCKIFKVHNAFLQPENFLSLFTDNSWNRLVNAAGAYLEARAQGKEVTLNDLRNARYTPFKKTIGGLDPGHPLKKIKSSVAAVPPPVSRPGVGTLTLEMLEKFTITGPRPLQRGSEFLYAQGAKAVPEAFEAAWRALGDSPLPEGGGVRSGKGMLVRRGEKAFVLIPEIDSDGRAFMLPIPVPEALAQGVVLNSFVEAAFTDEGALALRRVGAYPLDMMIGRVARLDGRLVLMGLFRDGDRPVSLYAPLPLEGGVETQEGRIVQAFVKPAESGFAAVPLIDLGRDITPEIAAREIAFRYGARGYFEGGVIRQAEEIGRTEDPQAEFARIREAVAKSGKGKVADLRGKPFITIDPAGAGDLDDAFFVEKNPDGGFTWYLATADVAQHVAPGTPAFRHAARVGNTFYSIDKDGVPEYPMNHPVVSKYVSSLLNGKDSIAMISRLSFDANGVLDKEGSEVFLGVIRVQGRYSYDQVAALWNGRKDHGIGHVDQVNVARELSRKLDRQDGLRGKIKLDMANLEHFKRKNGWVTESVVEDPLAKESHLLIEELKVYGNQEIATLLNRITQEFRVPHVSRIHPEQSPSVNARMEKELNGLGVPWTQGNIWEYLARLNGRIDLSPELKQAAQMLVLTSRRSARYALEDADGHEGLALEAGAYDHPSTPIRRFSDMYNRALLEAYLEGGDPKKVYEAVVADVKSMGFEGLEEYVEHLNAREKAAKQMDYAVDDFMSVYELAKPENQGRTFTGHVKMVRKGDAPSVSIQLKEVGAALVVRGVAAKNYKLLDEVQVRVKGADLESQNVDADIRVVKSFAAPSEAKQGKGNKQWKGKGKGKKFSGSAPRRRRR